MPSFTFLTPNRIIFGPGTIERLGSESRMVGSRALLVTGRSFLRRTGILDNVIGSLKKAGMDCILYDGVAPEPELNYVKQGIERFRAESCDMVIAVGGGSVLDVGKAVAGFAALPGEVEECFAGREITPAGFPWVGVPTTAGTGSEATKVSVLTDPKTGIKQGLRHESWMATLALVDPDLTLSLPPDKTAYSGMDALTQAIEAYTSIYSHPLSDALSLKAAQLIGQNIKAVYQNGSDQSAREAVALGSITAGLAFSNVRLGTVHGIAHPVGSCYHLPHGLVCGVLLPWVMEFNIDYVRGKYARLAEAWGLPAGRAEDAIAHIRKLNEELGIPAKLGELGLDEGDIPTIVEQSMPSGSLKANPRKTSEEDVETILRANL